MPKIHPALALYRELFDKWATPDNPNLPEYIVSMSPFIMELKRRGMEYPENIPQFWDWSKKIGLNKFAGRICRAHRKRVKERQAEAKRTQFQRLNEYVHQK